MSADALKQEIRKSSEDRALQVLADAKKKADAIINEAEAEAKNVLERRVKEAERHFEQSEKFESAKEKMENTRKILQLQSSYYEQAFRDAESRVNTLAINDSALYRRVLTNFVTEALERIGSNDLVVVARDSDRSLIERILDELRGQMKTELKCLISPSLNSAGGVIVHSANMRVYYVNTFESRFATAREDFRADIVEALERRE